MNEKQARYLLERYCKDLCSDEEKKAIDGWIEQEIESYTWNKSQEEKLRLSKSIKRKIDEQIRRDQTALPLPARRSKQIWPWLSVAATLILCISVSTYFIFDKQPTSQTLSVQGNDLPPGQNKAVLTLAGGRQIVLNGAHNGKLARQSNTVINKTADGRLIYLGNGINDTKPTYNILTTPPGGQYSLILADGTRITLNAASSIKYPALFTGSERRVELTGEAYFEVAHNAVKPFKVVSNGQEVRVVGTHFNINSYPDEPVVKTTLLEGSVQISDLATHQSNMLDPGQQSVFSNHQIVVRQANTEEVMAWKNGYFIFNSEDIVSIMRKVSRWYDVEVIYNGPIPEDKYVGMVSRFANVSQLLHKLALTNKIHFKIEGRRIMVSK